MANGEPRKSNARNARTVVTLVSIALVFFLGVIIAHAAGVGEAGLSVLGIAILVFLGVAIGRNLMSRR